MKELEIKDETQGKHYEVDVRRIRPLQRAGGNPREDYGDLEELAADILQNGVVTPLRGFRVSKSEAYDWEIVAGHRRLAAAMLLVEKGHTIRAKIISIGDSRTVTDEMILMEHFTTNSGKPFTPVEQAETVRRLQAIGWKNKEISVRLGKSMRLIQNLALLASAPIRIRKMISDKKISYTLVLDILKDSADYNEALDKIEASFGIVKTIKKSTVVENEDSEQTYEVSDEVHEKVTKKHFDKATNKVDSFKELQMVFKSQIDKPKDVINSELFSFAKKIIENKLTRSQIESLIFN
ncbi:MAG: ParB N-terminal domain-containing protein [Bacteroidota bacterium]